MEALLLTAILVVLIMATLLILARTWPHSSRYTGFGIRDHDEPARSIREDDDAPPWHIPPPADSAPGESPPRPGDQLG